MQGGNRPLELIAALVRAGGPLGVVDGDGRQLGKTNDRRLVLLGEATLFLRQVEVAEGLTAD